jgi:NAD(P)-dependent dehydrogenase (short-subunit alcohol dehydrogenase family)
MNDFSLKGKHIFITGASSGIGQQCAVTCSNYGAMVSILGRNRDRLEETEKLIRKDCNIIMHDLNDFEKFESIIADSVKKNGKISGFIHSAGFEETVPLRTLTKEKIVGSLKINAIAGFELARIISKKKYISETTGSFVFFASVMGFLGEAGKVAYSLSKGAIIGGVKSMALELAQKKIRVNSISPAVVRTPMTDRMFEYLPENSQKEIINAHPLGLGESIDVALAAVYLLSNASKWITGTNLIIDGGYSAK